jgi:hypothetical protein
LKGLIAQFKLSSSILVLIAIFYLLSLFCGEFEFPRKLCKNTETSNNPINERDFQFNYYCTMQFNSVSSEKSRSTQSNQINANGNTEMAAGIPFGTISMEHFERSSEKTSSNMGKMQSEATTENNLDATNHTLLELSGKSAERAIVEMTPTMLFPPEDSNEKQTNKDDCDSSDQAELPQKEGNRMAALANGLSTLVGPKGSNVGNGCETSAGNALAPNRNQSNSTTMEGAAPLCESNQSGQENVEGSAGKETGLTCALSSGVTAPELASAIKELVGDQSEKGLKFWGMMKSLMADQAPGPAMEVADNTLRASLPGSFVSASALVQALEEGKADGNQATKETKKVGSNYDHSLLIKRELIKANHPDAFDIIESLDSPQRSTYYQKHMMTDSEEAIITEEHIEARFNANANNHRSHKRRADGTPCAELLLLDDAFSQHRAREIVNEAKRNGTAEGLQSAVIVRNNTPSTNRSKNAGRGGRGAGQSHETPGAEAITMRPRS